VRALRDAGHATSAFVGGGQIMPRYGLDRGFGNYDVINTRDIDAENRRKDRLGELHDAAESFLTGHVDEPFFLFLHTYEPHTPYAPPDRHLEQARSVGAGGIGADLDAPLIEYEAGLGVPAEAWIADERRLKYAAEVAYVDEFLGNLFDTIDRLQLADNTVIILTADHGESLGERGIVGHNKFYTEQLRVPLIVRAPGAAPARTAEPVELIDVMPTIFAQLGVEPPYPFEGRDLSPVLAGESTDDPERYRFSENKGQVAVLQGSWKVVFSQRDPNDFQLFDMAADPGELTDLSDERAAVAGRLIRAYQDMVAANASLAALFPRAGEDFDATLDEETRRQLRALGYLQ
jgi:arylsulfatase A-like enzyme